MNPELNTLLTTLYVLLTDRVLTGMFPSIPQQSGYNKRLRAAATLISATITALAKDTPSWHDVLRLIDSTPLPCGSRETVKRSDLSGHAGYGYCASHSRYLWGFRLYLISTPEETPVILGLANPKVGEREVTQALLEKDNHLVHAGQVILATKASPAKTSSASSPRTSAPTSIRPDGKDEEPRFGKLGGIRQWIESVFDTLKGQLTLEEHGGRTLEGIKARVAARLLALAAGIWHNWLTGAPRKRALIAYDHQPQ